MLKSGMWLKNLAKYLRLQALKNCDKILLNKLKNFLELYETDWQIYATNARATAEDKKVYAPEELPQERDIKIFRKYILEQIVELTAKVKRNTHNIHDVRKLAKLTLARVLTFNAHRGGEVSKLKLRHWEGVKDDRYWENYIDVCIDLVFALMLATVVKIRKITVCNPKKATQAGNTNKGKGSPFNNCNNSFQLVSW